MNTNANRAAHQAAFPRPFSSDPDAITNCDVAQAGMTLRTWLAGQALAGLASELYHPTDPVNAIGIAADALHIADALLERLYPSSRPPSPEEEG